MTLSPTDAQPNEPISVEVTIMNNGTQNGPFTIPLLVDGNQVTSQSVTIAPGASQDIQFTFKTAQSGDHVLSVGSQKGDVIVGGAG